MRGRLYLCVALRGQKRMLIPWSQSLYTAWYEWWQQNSGLLQTVHRYPLFTTEPCLQSPIKVSLFPFFGVGLEWMCVLGHPFIYFDRGTRMHTPEWMQKKRILSSTVRLAIYSYYVFFVSSLASLVSLQVSAPINHKHFHRSKHPIGVLNLINLADDRMCPSL